jgi:hypothetical protein
VGVCSLYACIHYVFYDLFWFSSERQARYLLPNCLGRPSQTENTGWSHFTSVLIKLFDALDKAWPMDRSIGLARTILKQCTYGDHGR